MKTGYKLTLEWSDGKFMWVLTDGAPAFTVVGHLELVKSLLIDNMKKAIAAQAEAAKIASTQATPNEPGA